MPNVQNRRRFLSSLALAGAAGLSGASASNILGTTKALGAEPPPEITEIRFKKQPIYCEAPQYVAEELLRAEGFTIRQVEVDTGGRQRLSRGEYDLALTFAPDLIAGLDAGEPITVVAGVHVGCFELFAQESIRGIPNLKNKTVGARAASAVTQLVRIMASLVGLDPAKDIIWVTDPTVTSMELFAAGKIDAFLAIPPEPQELRARNIGHVLVNSSVDRPWSQYFCCMLAGKAEFVRQHPIVIKRVLRAMLKGADLCASEPRRVAQLMVDHGFAGRYDFALQTLNDVPYNAWRDHDPEDTMRWYALRLHEAGMIKSSPQKIIAEGTDWRFLNELKRELKA